jgi:CheY-like chemotaxis protein
MPANLPLGLWRFKRREQLPLVGNLPIAGLSISSERGRVRGGAGMLLRGAGLHVESLAQEKQWRRGMSRLEKQPTTLKSSSMTVRRDAALAGMSGSARQRGGRQGAPKRVLLIDDDPSVLDALGQMIAGDGFDVLAESNVEAAICVLGAESVDLVITDLRMPSTTGWDLLYHYHFHRPELPIFVVSALPPQECVGIQAVASAFFQKPVDCEGLLSTLHEFLDP